MLAAVKGVVRGNINVIENEDLRPYDGTEAVVTLLDTPIQKKQNKAVDWDSFVIPSERGKNVEEYMREMRDNDKR